MIKNLPKASLLFIAFTLIGLYSAISYSEVKKLTPNTIKVVENDDYNQFLQDVFVRVKKDYIDEKTDKQIAEAAASGILSSLDPHSSYLNEDDLKEMQIQTKGEFGGLGIEITSENSLIKVVTAIDSTPAQKAGIKAGDYIAKIDGKSVIGVKIDDVVKKLRGKPNTKIALTILRKGENAPFEVILQRQNIQIKAIKSSKEKDVAYIKISLFSEQAYSGMLNDLKKIINEIGQQNFKGIILDLRNNPGGLLDEAVKVSGLFLDKDKIIVSIAGRVKSDNKIYKNSSEQSILTKNVPIVVLINQGSASASEIVAGALQDNKRAIILGLKSFGKGSVQSIIPLSANKGAIKMTTALYYTPSGKSIQAQGIEPDIVVNEAKLETIKKDSIENISEASLDGHLKKQIEDEIVANKKSQINDDNLGLYEKDYQLARAIDLLRGISVYKDSGK